VHSLLNNAVFVTLLICRISHI